MIKEFIYDCESAPRREENQCYNDISALMLFSLLCDIPKYIDKKKPDYATDFFNKKLSFSAKSAYAEKMQDDLIAIKSKWLRVRRSRLPLELIAFIVELMGNKRKFDSFVKFYASEENQVYLSVERLLEGLATAEGDEFGFYTVKKEGKFTNYIFIETVAIEQFLEFKELIGIEKFL